jgi:membrane protease YdiL (CAAX protease family)
MLRAMIAAITELYEWIRQHGWLLFLATVAAYSQQHYELYGPPSHLTLLPSLALAMFVVFPLWAAILHDTRDRVAWGLAAIGCALALGPALAWAYAPGMHEQLKDDPRPLIAGAGVGLAFVIAAAARGNVSLGWWGLGPGDFRWWAPKAGVVLGVLIVAIPIVAWLRPEFTAFYPRYKPGRTDFGALLQYQLAIATYMFCWEFLFRGFMLNGLGKYIGPVAAILAQCYPFFLLHHTKPESEMVSSWFGGILIGWFCWRAKSMWPGFLLHSVQYSTMEITAFAFRHLGGTPTGG